MKKNILCLLLIFIVFWSVSISVQNFEISWPVLFAGNFQLYEVNLAAKNIAEVFPVREYMVLHPELFTKPGVDDAFHYVVVLKNDTPVAVAFFDLSAYTNEQLVQCFRAWARLALHDRFLLSGANFARKELYVAFSPEQINLILGGTAPFNAFLDLLIKVLTQKNIGFVYQTIEAGQIVNA